jgi:hypothetical protein
MADRSILSTVAMVVTLLAMTPCTLAQPRSPEKVNVADSVGGIRTDRLTPGQRRIWKRIEQIAEAMDKAGQPLHPRLYCLWQWAKGSGHTITIDMSERRGSQCAGKTTPGEVDPNGHPRAAGLWLHLWAIDNARVNPASPRSDGLIQFYRLGKYERYAEIVGHELAHAFLILENPEYAHLCSEMRLEADRYLLSRLQNSKASADDAAARQKQVRLLSINQEIEKPAEEAELEIWRELVNAHRK